MPIAILVLALVAYLAALAAWPRARLPGAIAGLVVAVALGLYLWRDGAPEAEQAAGRIPVEALTLDEIAVAPTPRGATLTGRVANGSDTYRLRELTLVLRLRDCPAPETVVETCPVIGEASAIARPDVPPGQLRALTAHFGFTSLPPVSGTLRWDWRIAGTRATAG